jgi:pyridoxine 5'-phosphate synthase PdxJ
MRAGQIIVKAAFGPESLKVMSEAFDAALTQIADTYGNDPVDIEKGRLRLANAVLAVASKKSRHIERLKRAALEAMALGYKQKAGNPLSQVANLRSILPAIR